MLTHDRLRLAVSTYGPDDAPVTVVLAHCWTLNRANWQYQVRDLLAEFGHRVRILAWDHRGHGESDPSPRSACTIDNLAHDMGDVVDACAPTGPLVLAGHSIGGMTMCALALHRPDVVARAQGALFVSTAADRLDTVTLGLPEIGPALRAQIPRMLALRSRTISRRARRRAPIIERRVMSRFLFGDPMRLADSALAVEGLIRCPGDTVVGFYEDCMRHDRRHLLSAYDSIPTTVLVGTADLLTPPRLARRLATAVDGARLRYAEGAGHMLPLERDALVSEELIRLVRPLVVCHAG